MHRIYEFLKANPDPMTNYCVIAVDDDEWSVRLVGGSVTSIGRSTHSIDEAAQRCISALEAMKNKLA